MKKVLIVIAVLSLFFMNSCKGEAGLDTAFTTQSTVSPSEIQENLENSETVKRKIAFLSEQFDFDEERIMRIAAWLEYFGVKDIKKIDIVKDAEEYNVACIMDVTDSAYYMSLLKPRGYFGRNILTAEEWELAQKHVKFFSENFDFSELEIERTAEQMAVSGIKEIKEWVVEDEALNIIRVKDVVGEVYCVILDSRGHIESISKGNRKGELIFHNF